MAPTVSVVVIDDDADLRRLIKLTMEFTAGWQVHLAANGAEGLALARQVRPDVVVVDLMMPELDGFEVCRRLRADPATAAIPTILLTARKKIDEARVADVGAAGVLFKPFEPGELAARILDLSGTPDA
jgi:DNA-binding response OmpR family regulator